MLVISMIYIHPHHCLSRNIPHLGSRGVLHEDYYYLGLPNPQRISVLHNSSYLGWPISILKEYQMPNDYPIPYSVFLSEDKNNVSISPSQLGRTNLLIPVEGMYLSSLLS